MPADCAASPQRRTSLRCAIALVVALGLVVPHTALAAPDEGTQSDDASARFDRAERLYREGRYEEAIEILSGLIAEFPEPILRFNLGRAHESAGRLEEAIGAYERYLEDAPDAPDRVDVEQRIERLHAQLAAQTPEPEPEPEPQPPPDRGSDASLRSKPIVAPWVIAGVGGAGLVVGGVFGGLSRARTKDARDEQTDQVQATGLQDDARRFATVANVSLAVGGAVALAGLAWGIVAVAKRKRRGTPAIALRGLTLAF